MPGPLLRSPSWVPREPSPSSSARAPTSVSMLSLDGAVICAHIIILLLIIILLI
jgi:hypothetical protein